MKPIIGITMGDPAGIGPEIVVKALTDKGLTDFCNPVIIGDLAALERTAEFCEIELNSRTILPGELTERPSFDGTLIVDLKNVPERLPIAEESAAAGKASGEYIEIAVGLCQEGLVDAIATAPINKRSFNSGGFDYPGHTEFLADLTGTDEFSMSFFAEKLRVVLLSTHVSLLDAIGIVKRQQLASLIRFSAKSLETLLGRKVTIAVSGLNPHASEGGMFGDEEETEIRPAVEECRSEGIEVSGPYSPDTIYIRGYQGEFDAVIACYHDQATIAVKCLSFGKAVNVTLGLPIIRTSVDHGTAFEIAGMNKADSGSMQEAISLAGELAMLRFDTARLNKF